MMTAVTGWGLRTPLGGRVDDVVRRVLAGERGAKVNSLFDASTYPCVLAATCDAPAPPSRSRRHVRRAGLLGMEAADDAMAMADPPRGDRLGIFVGYGGLRADWDNLMVAFSRQREDGADAWANGFVQLHPYWMLSHLSNNAHAILSMELDARGDGLTLGGANAGGQALAAAARALAAHSIDAALVFAYDTLLEPETLLALGVSGLATAAPLSDLQAPYSAEARGFVPGEAGAAVVLQRSEDAASRALALLDVRVGADGSPGLPEPTTLRRCAAPLADGASLLDGAGFADPHYDAEERETLAQVVGDDAVLCATTAAFGQTGAATALLQLIVLTECLRRQLAPPIAGLMTATDGPLRVLTRAAAHHARAAIAVSGGAPGLATALRVQLP